ncbi:MAG: hypothetical protein NVS9B1_14350 [Candidatus Dormibacteraceae bacterium]
MARKQRRKPAPARSRPVRPQGPSTLAEAPATSSPRAGGRVGGEQAMVRSVEMSLGGSAQMRGRGRNRFVLEGGDPGIPLDRVPYFTTDLRRIAIVGVLMIVLLVVAAYTIIPLVVR